MNEQSLQPSFTLSEIKEKAIALTKKYWATYLLIGLAGFAVIAPIEMINVAWEVKYGAGIVPVLFTVVSLVAQMILVIAFTRYALAASEDKRLQFIDYFRCNVKMIVAMVLASLLYGLMVFGGLIALVIPGIILGVAFSYNSFLIVEKNAGAIDALKMSWKITKGNRMNIFIFGALLTIVSIVAIIGPVCIAMLPVLFRMENALIITSVLGIVAFAWLVVAGIVLGAFGMIASALMYQKMQATRK